MTVSLEAPPAVTAPIHRRDVIKAATVGLVAVSPLASAAASPVSQVAPPQPSASANQLFMQVRNYVATAMSRQLIDANYSSAWGDDFIYHAPLAAVAPIRYMRRSCEEKHPSPPALDALAERIRRGDDLRAGVMLTDVIRAGMEAMHSNNVPWTMTSSIPLATPENYQKGLIPFRLQSYRLACDIIQLDGHWLALAIWGLTTSMHNALLDEDRKVLRTHPGAKLDQFMVTPVWCAAEKEQFIFTLFAWLEGVGRYTL